ncbi:MAG: hypothetical protein IJA71_00315 [Clostridia bacterium]|nr:hypothetical protein [Clostridia bacterium]
MKKFKFPSILASIICFLLAMVLIFGALGRVREDSLRRQRDALEEALNKSLLLCYSLEGRYPATLEELLEKCPLAYDRERFVIDYRLHGGNILPEITILEK